MVRHNTTFTGLTITRPAHGGLTLTIPTGSTKLLVNGAGCALSAAQRRQGDRAERRPDVLRLQRRAFSLKLGDVLGAATTSPTPADSIRQGRRAKSSATAAASSARPAERTRPCSSRWPARSAATHAIQADRTPWRDRGRNHRRQLRRHLHQSGGTHTNSEQLTMANTAGRLSITSPSAP